MNSAMMDLMQLQGELKVRMMTAGIPQEQAHHLAAEMLDAIATSNVASDTHRSAYKLLQA